MCGVLSSLFQLLGCVLLFRRKELGTILGLASMLCWKKNSSSIIVSFVVVCYLFSCVSLNTDTNNVERWQNLGSSVVISFPCFEKRFQSEESDPSLCMFVLFISPSRHLQVDTVRSA